MKVVDLFLVAAGFVAISCEQSGTIDLHVAFREDGSCHLSGEAVAAGDSSGVAELWREPVGSMVFASITCSVRSPAAIPAVIVSFTGGAKDGLLGQFLVKESEVRTGGVRVVLAGGRQCNFGRLIGVSGALTIRSVDASLGQPGKVAGEVHAKLACRVTGVGAMRFGDYASCKSHRDRRLQLTRSSFNSVSAPGSAEN